MNWCDPKNQFKPNCAVKRQYRYLHIRSVYQTIPCSQSFISSQVVIMLKARRASYNFAFKLKIVAEAEAVENNSEVASVSPWSVAGVKIKPTFFNGDIKLSAKRKTMACLTPKYPELDQRILEWLTEQRSQVFCQTLILYFKSTEEWSRSKSISWLKSECELNVWLVVS